MVFTDIRLQNFRSYVDSSFEIDPGVNIVVGPNTAGKTNLLEAILVSCLGKSYRVRDHELIRAGSDWARIDIHNSKNQQRTTKVTKEGEKTDKIFEVDGKQFKRMTKATLQPVVLFEPNHLFLFHDNPQKRREFIDELASQIDIEYQRNLNQYKRALAQRNSLLKQSRATDQIFVWDVKLADLGNKIVAGRTDIIGQINQKAGKIYSDLASKKTKVEFSYVSKTPLADYSSNLLKQLEQSFVQDTERGFTGHGPHRDDITATVNGEPVSVTASRGEIRTLMLALKIIETRLIEKSLDQKPILLLDDVFSELDGARRKALTDFLKDYQTIITTTDADVVVKNFSQNCQIIPLG
jgi:DNA replication and repair protein RecF